jgi:aryl-alcohol dehydrogenase-like predicted oxidoreductase
MNLNTYLTLGRSGLKISPLCLGTMTFGTEWGWGNDEADSKAIFDHYVDAGGNFIDTADGYTNGKSEELVGKFIRERNLRHKIALATKFTLGTEQGNPNAGGNGRKNIYRALEASLKRLGTDFVDLYWLHCWDQVTPVEEVVGTLDDLVREGKIRYAGFSDVPAWYASRAQTLVEKEGRHRLVALQLEYSLVERNIEREHVPLAQELGYGICPWSPLAMGILTGKYRREDVSNTGRLSKTTDGGNPVFERFNDRNWKIVDTLVEVAKELGRSPAEVALHWAVTQPGITSVIIGATKIEQLKSNLASLDLFIPGELRKKLDDATALDIVHPYMFFRQPFEGRINGGVEVRKWRG